MKREWEIGRCIHNIYEPERALPGYMGTGEGVVTEDGNFVGAPAYCLLVLPLMPFGLSSAALHWRSASVGYEQKCA